MAFEVGVCPDENMLVLLAEGALEGAERSAVDRHLDGCAECSQLVGHLARLAAPGRPAPQRYKVVRQIGEGAMGVVWEAEDSSLHRRVALKFVRPEGADNRALRKRLLREARALAQVRHPNVVSVYDAGETDDEVCLVLELVIGTNARAWRNAAPRSFEAIYAVWRQAAAGVAAVHRAGIVHRDIKPDNVLVADHDGRVLVGDFGLATGDFGLTTTTSITQSGAMLGTPLYMAPEQLADYPASPKTDQYALCASIWEAFVGERPFRGSTIAAIVLAMSKPVIVPKRPNPERAVLEVLAKGLDPDPDRRFADVDSLVVALDRAVSKRPPNTGRIAAFVAGGVLIAAVAAAAAVALTGS
jgi:eukaryotic-like serine/threonine-protein kinase